MKQSWLKLTLITNKNLTDTDLYLNFIMQCAIAGVTAVQLREKNMSDDQLVDFGLQLKKQLKPYSIPLIINDSIDIACELNAEGLHLGQSDGNIIQARRKLGHKKLIGLSVNSQAQLMNANALPVDYLGIGPVFTTPNKPDAPLWHCRGLQQAITLTSLPIVAIGGINLSNADRVMQMGAAGIAAIGAFHEADYPDKITRSLLAIIKRTFHAK